MSAISEIIKDIPIPEMVTVRQNFSAEKINDVAAKTREQIARPEISSSIQPGMTVAITAGSRGVSNCAKITKTVVECVKERGANPFIVAAMGSHGGVTEKGQRDILRDYDITEESMGCPLKIGIETALIGRTDTGFPVYIDRYAAEADGIIAVNRIKPHTAFRGQWESGLIKMLAIGLGKQKGAEFCHSRGMQQIATMIPSFGKAILEHANVLFGLGMLENAYDQTADIVALTPEEFITVEPRLLMRAKSLIGKILLDETDVLIVDVIGKNYSGAGMDPNITGTFANPYATGGIRAQRVVVLDVSDESHGNTNGLGLATCASKRAFDKFNPEMTYPNALTGRQIDGAKIPLIFKNDKECIQAAIILCTDVASKDVRIVRIKNTLELGEIEVSVSLLDEVKKHPAMEIVGTPAPLPFREDGNILS